MNVSIKGRLLAMAGECLSHRVGQTRITQFGQTAMPESRERDVLRQVRRISNAARTLREKTVPGMA
jgi:hypothetical protein